MNNVLPNASSVARVFMSVDYSELIEVYTHHWMGARWSSRNVAMFTVIRLPRFKVQTPARVSIEISALCKPQKCNQKWYLCRSQARTRRESWWWGADNTTTTCICVICVSVTYIIVYCIICIVSYIVLHCIVFIHFYSTSHSMSLSEALLTTVIDTVSEFT